MPRTPANLSRLRSALQRWEVTALFPFAVVAGVAIGGDAVLWICAIFLPLLFTMRSWAGQDEDPRHGTVLEDTRPTGRDAFVRAAESTLAVCQGSNMSTAVMLVEVDPQLIVNGAWRNELCEDVYSRMHERLGLCVRERDVVARCGENMYGVLLHPVERADLEITLSIVDRLQACVAEPMAIDGHTLHFRSSIGLCLQDRSPTQDGDAIVAAAECALRAAMRGQEGGVRSFTKQMQDEVEVEHQLSSSVYEALEKGDIRPWFQPQISTETGGLTGFEALARWQHPELGVLTPKQFMPAIAASHTFDKLGETILLDSLEALRAWERAGISVGAVSINLSAEELRDPHLAERIIWQVDRYDQRPDRICIEILETVTLAHDDDAIIHNLRALRGAGFRMDLDDFGTGHASISHIARFGVSRIKIDRSFVTKVDSDPGQKRLVAAILSMAEQLGVETLAEGVETPGEHSTLAQLGCDHVQGFGIAKPMPLEDTIGWVNSHNATIVNTRIGNRRLG